MGDYSERDPAQPVAVNGPVAVTNSTSPFLVRAVLSSTAADNPVSLAASSISVSNQVRVSNSTAADLLMRPVFSSSSADNPVQISGNSTTVIASGNSSVTISAIAVGAGRIPIGSTAAENEVLCSPKAGSTWVVRPVFSSTGADNPVSLASVAPGAGRLNIGSTAADNAVVISGNSSAVISSAAIGWGLSGFGSKSGQAATAGDNSIVSSIAAKTIYVYAWTLSPLSTVANLVRWLDGSTTEVWRVRILGGSTAGMGFVISEQAVSPPAYLFKTSAAAALTLNCASSGVNYGVSYWQV